MLIGHGVLKEFNELWISFLGFSYVTAGQTYSTKHMMCRATVKSQFLDDFKEDIQNVSRSN